MDNVYNSDEAIRIYSKNLTRFRSLNPMEKIFVDRYDVKNKKVLVVGSGAGRVPANLLIYGNIVIGIELSPRLNEIANNNFPRRKFTDLTLMQGDGTNMGQITNNSFDVVFFPQNGLDLIEPQHNRDKAISEMFRVVKRGGIVAFSSHNKHSLIYSYKVPMANKIKYIAAGSKCFWGKYCYSRQIVFGESNPPNVFKATPKYIIEHVKEITDADFVGYTCMENSFFDSIISKKLFIAKLIFPYILYVFKKR